MPACCPMPTKARSLRFAVGKEGRSAPECSVDGPAVVPTTSIEKGVLFGWGRGGSNEQQKYVVVRFALLAPASGGFCEAI